jgi:site-specific DNA-methyltransferase (adenine-specific)
VRKFFPASKERKSLRSIEPLLDRVIHSDCLDALPAIPSESVDLVVTDPPYLVNYRPRDGRRCSGDDTDYWLNPAFRELYRVLKPDSFCVSFYGWPWVDRFMAAWKGCGFRPVSHLTWTKSHCSREGYTRSFHEVGFLLAKGRPPKPKKPPPDVLPWEYTGNTLHPNQKPVIAIISLIEAFSKPGDIVLDPFCDSGTTGVAAKMCQRRFILFEKVWRHYQASQARLSRHCFE